MATFHVLQDGCCEEIWLYFKCFGMRDWIWKSILQFAIEISLDVNSPTGQKLWKVLFLKTWFMNVRKDDKSS